MATRPPPRASRRSHRVVVLALESVVAFELGLPHRFFTASAIDPDWPGTGAYTPPAVPAYEVLTVTVDDRPVTTSAGYAVTPTHPHTVLARADTVVIPGITQITDRHLAGDGRLSADLAALLATARPGVRWLSICTGAFVLAATGMLDGLPATTHWAHADHFRRLFPQVRLDPDVLYVDNGDILTSAGNAAGIDLLLHVLRRDLGSDVANRVARGAVVAPWRAGGQAQFIERPVPDTDDEGTGPARAWVLAHLDEPASLADLASRAGMSVRTFTRRFREETGETAGSWLLRVRVDHARHLLETTDLPVDRVATQAGFGTSASLRQHLTSAVGMPPLAYRRTYRAEGA
jgi:transcriptional regulator GlxA family with amidase domain